MARISGIGFSVPETLVTNDDLSRYMETSDAWIKERAGIESRRWVRKGHEEFLGVRNSELAYKACRAALADCKAGANDIEAIIYATLSPDSEFSGSGWELKASLGMSNAAPIFEVRNQCSGFLYSLSIAQALVDGGAYGRVLVVGSEIHSSGVDLSTRGRNVAVLFGDGAGAAVLERGGGIKAISLGCDGNFADKLMVAAPGFSRAAPITQQDFAGDNPAVYPYMDGKFVFKMASTKMPEMVRRVLDQAGVTLSDVALIIPHQANQRIIDMLARELKCPEKVFSNIARYGNTTAASIPIALCEAVAEGRIKRGELLCLVSFGAGFSWGAVLMQW